jgi:hypothetical protein
MRSQWIAAWISVFVFLFPKAAAAAPDYPPALADAAADVRGFCALDKHPDRACPSDQEMAWRLRVRQSMIAKFLQAGAAVSRAGGLTAEQSERLTREMQMVQPYAQVYKAGMDRAASRAQAQDRLIAELNGSFDCKILRFNEGEQKTYFREMSLPECDPLREVDFSRASHLLDQLADIALPVDAPAYRAKARAFADLGPDVRELGKIRSQLLQLKVIDRDYAGQMRLNHIGHPFQRDDYTNWLEAYIYSVRKLAKRLNTDVACPVPACDPVVFKLAEAVTLRPPLDWVYLRDGDRPVAPSAYSFSYFSQRYAANSGIRRAVGLDPDQDWLWNSEIYNSRLTDNGSTLLFTRVFAKEEVLLTVDGWKSRTEYPYVVPLFFMFQEARSVLDGLRRVEQGRQLAEAVKEVRFERADSSGRLLALTKIPRGYRLSLKVMDPPHDLPVEAVRQALQQQIPDFFSAATQSE